MVRNGGEVSPWSPRYLYQFYRGRIRRGKKWLDLESSKESGGDRNEVIEMGCGK